MMSRCPRSHSLDGESPGGDWTEGAPSIVQIAVLDIDNVEYE